MRPLGPWRPGVRIPPPVRGSVYDDLVDALIERWNKLCDDKQEDSNWCIENLVAPTVDVNLSGIRRTLNVKTELVPTLDGLKLRWRWVNPLKAWENLYDWKRRQQMVQLWVVRPMDLDPRLHGFMRWAQIREMGGSFEEQTEKACDDWEKRNKFPHQAPDIGPASAGLPAFKERYRFLPGELVSAFRKRLRIADEYTLAGWVALSGYPLGAEVTPEAQAEWLARWSEGDIWKGFMDATVAGQ